MWKHLIFEVKLNKEQLSREVKSAVGKLLVFPQTNQSCLHYKAFEEESTT